MILKTFTLYWKARNSQFNKSANSHAKSDRAIHNTLERIRTAEGVENKLRNALLDIHEIQLVINSLLRDINNQIFALDLRLLARDKAGYIQSILQHIVVLVISFDEKVNKQFLNKNMQAAINTISLGPTKEDFPNTELRKALKRYNKLSDHLRPKLTRIRNTVGAHRDPSYQAVQDAAQELGSSGIVEIVGEIFELAAVYSTISANALIALQGRLSDPQQ